MRGSLTLIMVALLVCTSAHALTISGDDTEALPNDTDVTLTLPEFDNTLGTLTNVYVQLELRLMGAQVQLDNDSANPQEGTARVLNTASSLTSDVALLKDDFDNFNAGDLAINASQVFNLTATSGDPVGSFENTAAGDYAIWQPGTLTSGDAGNIFSNVWGQYIGTGTFDIVVNTTYLTSATFEGELGYFEGNTPSGQIYAQVVYDYVVPEPATMALLSLGLAFIRKRK